MSTTTPRPPLPRWIWITLAAVVAAVLVAGVVLWAQRPTADDAGPTTPTTPAPSTRPSDAAGVVTGCLVEGQSVEMFLDTQKEAPQTEAGAVEFATAAMKWPNRWPFPSAEEYQSAIAKTWGGSVGFNQEQYDAMVAGPNASGGVVAEGTPFHLTSVLGRYYVDNYEGDIAQVTVGLTYVIGDAVSPLYRKVATYDLEWTDDGWKTVYTSQKHDVYELFDERLGAPFSGGC